MYFRSYSIIRSNNKCEYSKYTCNIFIFLETLTSLLSPDLIIAGFTIQYSSYFILGEMDCQMSHLKVHICVSMFKVTDG